MTSMHSNYLATSADLASLKQILNGVKISISGDPDVQNSLGVNLTGKSGEVIDLSIGELRVSLTPKFRETGGVELILSLVRGDNETPVQMLGLEGLYVVGVSGARTPIKDSRSTQYSFRGLKLDTEYSFMVDNNDGQSGGRGDSPVGAPVVPTAPTQAGMAAATLPPPGVYPND